MKLSELETLCEGETLCIGSKECEIMSKIAAADYAAGKCFLALTTSAASSACGSMLGSASASAGALHSQSRQFKTPGAAAVGQQHHAAPPLPTRPLKPLFDPSAPRALVLSQPTADRVRQQKAGKVVDVVVE